MRAALRTCFNTGVIGPLAIIWLMASGLIAGPFLWLFPGKNGRNVRKFVYFQSWGIVFCMRLCARRFTVNTSPRPSQPSIIVANHASVLDLYTVAAFGYDNVVYITKGWVFKIPFFRFVMRGAGYLDAQTTPPQEMLAHCRRALENGCDIVLFPQGSRKNPTARFKSGAFYLAQATGAPVIPVAIAGSGDMIASGSKIIRPASIALHSLPAVYPQQFTGPLAHLEMARQVKHQIMQLVNQEEQV